MMVPKELLYAAAFAGLLGVPTVPLATSAASGLPAAATRDTLVIPVGKKVRVDGVVKPVEWIDADTLEIRAGPDWVVPVLLKHDGEALYVAFSNLVRGKEERYPEVLIDVAGNGGGWDDNDWWLHASYHDCTGRGFYSVYGHTCAGDASGWYASNFPLSPGRSIEFRVGLDFFGLAAGRSAAYRVFGLAFGVVESESRSVAASPSERRSFWPMTATMLPGTWALTRMAVLPQPSRR